MQSPGAPNNTAVELGALENSRPDLLFGYMYSEIADRLDARAVLSEGEELLTLSKCLTVSDVVAFAFLGAQLKSASSGLRRQHTRSRAVDAARRCRSCTINHARFDFAGITNLPMTSLYEYPIYRTHAIYSCLLHDEEGVKSWRTRMRGIYEWAVGTRAASVKEAVQALDGSVGIGPGRDDESTTMPGSITSAGSQSIAMSISPRTGSNRSIDMETLAQAIYRPGQPLQWPSFTPPRSKSDPGGSGSRRGDEEMSVAMRRLKES
ncbi:hypothetical protein EJ08DRAFT_406692 [Tothia fuscella]|uniref:Uncharacterized protein n=1 Tax=Tothia fuscella TaxID=1048955 RepID=A0A9P4NKI6_9PEZI|nr:hypothetical protein EJ08DRAFT_406692 [Tothia fuscella]